MLKEAPMATILIVDDSKLSRRMTADSLRCAGHQTIEADNGQTGLASLNDHQVDLIITDLLMAGVDGLQFLSYLHEKNVSVPVIVLSADVQTTSRQRCEDLGVSGFLHKPVKTDQLIDAVSGALGLPQGTGA